MNGDTLQIRDVQAGDYADLADLYNHYILESLATFEETPVSADEMGSRAQEVVASELPWLVAIKNDELVGYACAVRWKWRAAYRYSVETSIYLKRGQLGYGLGTSLYTHLFDRLRAAGMHLAIGGIALPNDASVALHEKMGFKKVAHFSEVGNKFDQWVDVGYWQAML